MAQRYAVQKNLKFWEKEGYKIVVGAERLGPEGMNQLILVEKKEKVVKPLRKKEEVKEDGRTTDGNVGRTGKSDNDSTGRRGKKGGGKGKSRR
jgi:hypothetical protein